jgi:hypothetical protein
MKELITKFLRFIGVASLRTIYNIFIFSNSKKENEITSSFSVKYNPYPDSSLLKINDLFFVSIEKYSLLFFKFANIDKEELKLIKQLSKLKESFSNFEIKSIFKIGFKINCP